MLFVVSQLSAYTPIQRIAPALVLPVNKARYSFIYSLPITVCMVKEAYGLGKLDCKF